VVVGEEAHPPYDRPPLSKQFLAGAWDEARIHHHTPDKLDGLGLDMMLGRRATALDTGARTLVCDGTELPYDGLIIATGAETRRWPDTEALDHVHVLRTLDDARAIRADLLAAGDGARVVVIGAGFIGSEVAATCHSLGASVTVVEAMPTPLSRVLGDAMGDACAQLHRSHGVTLRTGVGVDHLEPASGPAGAVTVELVDGTRLDADLVVVGIGVVPTTAWLEDSGLTVDNGVVCTEALFAADRVTAAGDVARWIPPSVGESIRVEHWTNAAEAGVTAARNLLAGPDEAIPYDPLLFFWSDQYDTKIQVIGRTGPDDEVVVVDGSVEEGKLVALYRRGDRLGGVLGFSRARQLMAYRPLLVAGASFDEALALSRS
jgi:NADPH-dependent 2,4-dienoyl-CoA reductase/sulfur reductase-like enzyme